MADGLRRLRRASIAERGTSHQMWRLMEPPSLFPAVISSKLYGLFSSMCPHSAHSSGEERGHKSFGWRSALGAPLPEGSTLYLNSQIRFWTYFGTYELIAISVKLALSRTLWAENVLYMNMQEKTQEMNMQTGHVWLGLHPDSPKRSQISTIHFWLASRTEKSIRIQSRCTASEKNIA